MVSAVSYPLPIEHDETHGLGYERVDDDPNVAVLVDTMDATARWPETLRLRTWERERLRLVWESPAPDGCFSMESLADNLVDAAVLTSHERIDFVETVRVAALRNQFTMSLTMHAVVATG